MGAMWSRPPPHVPRINQLIKYHGHRLSAIKAIWSHPLPHVPSINQLIKYHGRRLSAIEAIWSHPPPQVPSINQLTKYHGLGQLAGHRLSTVGLNGGHVVPSSAPSS
jgi:hypothetical protein